MNLYTGQIVNRFFGCDDGKFYGLKNGTPRPTSKKLKRFVFYGSDVNIYFTGGTDAKGSGFIQIWLEQEGFGDLSYILKVAEYGF